MGLFLKECERQDAKRAVEQWHYSHAYPGPPVANYGVYEDGQFIGAVVYGVGATPMIGRPFGLSADAVCELTRVALCCHAAPVSRIVAISLRLLHKARPDVRLVVSFADTAQGHLGTIYQAGGWVYLGSNNYHLYRINGKLVHGRSLYTRYGRGGQQVAWIRANLDPNAERVRVPPKHKYVWPFDKTIPLRRLPYPKRDK